MPKSTVEELVADCLAGDQQAWRELVNRYSALVWAIARSHRLSPADCEDVSQSTWTQVFKHLSKLRSAERFAEWISVAAKRESLKHIPRVAKYVPTGDPTTFDRADQSAPGPDEIIVDRSRDELVLRAFSGLPERDKSLLGLLICDQPRSYDEISALLGIPRGSIGPFRARSLARLARRMEELGAEVH